MNTKLTETFFRADITRFNLLPELKRLQCQTLDIGGDDDSIRPLADQEDSVAALPKDRVRFEGFAHAGHGVVDDAPAAFFKLVREFISA